MAEEWGTVIIKADEKVLDLLRKSESIDLALEELCRIGGIEYNDIKGLCADIESLLIKDGYGQFDFEISEWKRFSTLFVRSANDIEWYARIGDEYGSLNFFLLNEDGERVSFSIDQGGDMCEEEGYVEEAIAKINQWVSKLPQKIRDSFPDFIDTENISFDGP